MKLRNIRVMMASALVCMSSAMVSAAESAAEWDMDFGRDWTWEYLMQRHVSETSKVSMYMGFTGESFVYNEKAYHEFACLKEIRYLRYDDEAPIVDESPDPASRYIRQEGGQVFLLCKPSEYDNGKIRLEPVTDPESQKENELQDCLIYDFSKKEGDVIRLGSLGGGYLYCDYDYTICPVETIMIDGQPRKVMEYKEVSSHYKMIESIGTIYGGTLANYSFLEVNGGGDSIESALYVVLLQVTDKDGNEVFRRDDYDSYTGLGVSSISAPIVSRAMYYNLQGQPVANLVRGDIYILRDSSGSRKVVY